MDDNKNIEKKIKEIFDGLNKSAPKDLWNKLSEKTPSNTINKSIDAKIKEGFENLNKSAPPHVWSSVNRQLNIDKVWKRISAELDRRPVFYYWRRIAGIAALLLLLLSGSFYFLNKPTQFAYTPDKFNQQEQNNSNESFIPNNDNTSVKEKNKRNQLFAQKQNSNAEINNSNNIDNRNLQQNNSTQKFIVNKTIINDKRSKKFTDENTVTSSQSFPIALSDSMPLIAMIPIKSIFIENNSIPEPIFSPLSLSDNNPTDTTLVRKKRFELGVTYSYNNTWIINNNTRKSFDENSLIQTIPTFVGSYGITANYNIYNNSAISAEFYINSKYIQKYDEFIEGTFNSKSTESNYYKFTLLYQFNINQNPYKKIPSKYTFKAGVYGSSLKTIKHDYNRIITTDTDKYTATDYGIKLAIGQEKTFKHIIIGYGLNAEYGFKNIFDGNMQMSKDFNVTKNALIGGYVNVKYGF
ncbi:MAG: hypothetical protein Q8T03_02605 [Bacteroidota bacterium]|nr:hypothetical protein [Bacteroidota bacterium]